MRAKASSVLRRLPAVLLAVIAAGGARSLPPAPRTLRVCDDVSDPAGLDPHYSFDDKSADILDQIYEGLVRIDANGKVAPALAAGWRRVDDRSVRFFLRAGVRFQDGEPFDAAAAAASLRREFAAPAPPAALFSDVVEARAEGRYVLLVRTRGPDDLLLRRLAQFAPIVPPSLSRRSGPLPPDAAPVGTGPYEFVRWIRGREIVLAANPGYWRGRAPYDRVVFRFIRAGNQVPALIRGDLDLLTDVPAPLIRSVARAPGLRVLKVRSLLTDAFWFTSLRGPLEDVRVRRALNYAVDKSRLIREASGGDGVPIATLSMPGEFGHDARLAPYPYDPARARRLLRDAGYARGFTLRLLAVAQSARDAREIQADLRRVGVRLETTVVPISEGYQIAAEGALRRYDINANVAPDPIGHMGFLASVCFSSASALSAGGLPGFDARYRRMEEARGAASERRRAERLDDWIYRQAPAIFTYQRVRAYGLRRGVAFAPRRDGMLVLAARRPDAGGAR
ncbi:MAG: ABC transporter substrate-binding protein [Elusimicrobia bacterium]|nr:ABC transporter substrate-binding protein [Elusimicrobiota bacterium]